MNDSVVNNLRHFQKHSRLHFIGQWRTRMDDMLREWFAEYPMWNHGHLTQQRIFIHVDMDAFFCSVQLAKAEHATLRALPVAIAAGQYNSDISSCNYVARAFGVRAGMYVNAARKLCRGLIILHYDLESCATVAKTLYRIIFDTFPSHARMAMEVYSIDEVMIGTDSTDYDAMAQFCVHLRSVLEQTTGCTASCGVAANIMLARIATRMAKPNNIHVIPPADIARVMDALPFRRIHGVGQSVLRRVGQCLHACFPTRRIYANGKSHGSNDSTSHAKNSDDDNNSSNKNNKEEECSEFLSYCESLTCGEVQKLSMSDLQRTLGTRAGESFYHLCRGEDSRVVRRSGESSHRPVQHSAQPNSHTESSGGGRSRTSSTTNPAYYVDESVPNSVGCAMNYAVRPASGDDVWRILDDLTADVCAKLRRGRWSTSGLRVTVLERHPCHPQQTTKFMGRGYCLEVVVPVRLAHRLDESGEETMQRCIRSAVSPLLVTQRDVSDAERAAQLGLLDEDGKGIESCSTETKQSNAQQQQQQQQQQQSDHSKQPVHPRSNRGMASWTLRVPHLTDIVVCDIRGLAVQANGLRSVDKDAMLENKANKTHISGARLHRRTDEAGHTTMVEQQSRQQVGEAWFGAVMRQPPARKRATDQLSLAAAFSRAPVRPRTESDLTAEAVRLAMGTTTTITTRTASSSPPPVACVSVTPDGLNESSYNDANDEAVDDAEVVVVVDEPDSRPDSCRRERLAHDGDGGACFRHVTTVQTESEVTEVVEDVHSSAVCGLVEFGEGDCAAHDRPSDMHTNNARNSNKNMKESNTEDVRNASTRDVDVHALVWSLWNEKRCGMMFLTRWRACCRVACAQRNYAAVRALLRCAALKLIEGEHGTCNREAGRREAVTKAKENVDPCVTEAENKRAPAPVSVTFDALYEYACSMLPLPIVWQ